MQNAHMRVDGALPRGFVRFLGLTALRAEGDGGGFAAVFYNAAFGSPPPPFRGPPPPDERWEASLKVVVPFSPHKMGYGGLRQRSSPPCYLPTPFPGVGGERSETEGGGWMGRSTARVQRVAVAASPQFFIMPPSTTSWSPSPRRAVGGKFEGRGTPPP